MITGINQSKILTKHISCECKYKFETNVSQTNGGITINVDVSVKNIIYVKKNTFGTLVHLFFENGKYLLSIMDDSVITCDEVIELYD